MPANDSLRELAITALAAPHLSRDELIAAEEARRHAEQVPVNRSPQATWGQRLRGWIGRS
jgi:hypothetical protein